MVIIRDRERDNDNKATERVFKDVEGINSARYVYQAILEKQERRWKEELPERLFVYNL